MSQDTHNLQDFKNAKIHIEHLESIHKILALALEGLSYYEAYLVASQAASTLKMYRDFAATQLKHQRKILKNKGKKE